MNFSVLTASVADLPRIVSTTRRNFCGEMRAYLKTALVCMPYSAADTFLSPECALNVRVGANSPSLWPTMFSDTSTGTCRRPLCTAMVKPTISGMTMERRDQVLIGRRSFFWLAVCTFLARCKSANGPFLSERGTVISPDLQSFVLAALHDHAVGALIAARLLALGLQSPWAHGMRVALPRLALAAAVRVIDRVHDDTANRGTHAEPTYRAGLAEDAQVVLVIAHLADRGAAIDMHFAHLAGLQAQAGIHAFARRELRGSAGAARHLAALADFQFDVVYRAADRNMAQRHRVARLDRRIGAGADFIAGLDALRRENVAALAVLIQDQRQMRRAVRIVLETLDDAGNAVLVAFEIDQAVALLVSAADMARGLPARMVARPGAILLRGQ